ncbi:MAG TPA: hypothetical protein PKL15_10710 [Saprospiraceae bacterium]|nr:hypothetical protein [Saprospiraceae bacterium]HNL37847.1 hypothetical protein [Saprospiraceae bacterium]HNM25895.1 hypothetical protein [Saprospiraceae bacterium]
MKIKYFWRRPPGWITSFNWQGIDQNMKPVSSGRGIVIIRREVKLELLQKVEVKGRDLGFKVKPSVVVRVSFCPGVFVNKISVIGSQFEIGQFGKSVIGECPDGDFNSDIEWAGI